MSLEKKGRKKGKNLLYFATQHTSRSLRDAGRCPLPELRSSKTYMHLVRGYQTAVCTACPSGTYHGCIIHMYRAVIVCLSLYFCRKKLRAGTRHETDATSTGTNHMPRYRHPCSIYAAVMLWCRKRDRGGKRLCKTIQNVYKF